MDLTQDTLLSKNFIRNYEDNNIYVGEEVYDFDILISNNKIQKWEFGKIEHLDPKNLDCVFDLDPEIIIFGTGKKIIIPAEKIITEIHHRKIGIEYMITNSACKTFNILLNEGRNVSAILYV
tara:strand:+ start:312 stop:677 length:366 start_codon:yes stop_codon:yes gene_type:complete